MNLYLYFYPYDPLPILKDRNYWLSYIPEGS